MANRRYFQFSLRALFAAILVATLGLAIVSGYVRQGERQRYIISEVQRLGGTIFYSDERVAIGYERNYVSEKEMSRLRKLLGEGYYRTIDFVDISAADEVPDKLFASLAALPDLRGIQVAPAVSQYPGMALVQSTHPRLEVHAEWQIFHTFGNVISAPEELKAVLAKEHCVLFVDADWSPYSVMARPILARFANSWTSKGESPPIVFAALDRTDGRMLQLLSRISQGALNWDSIPDESPNSLCEAGIVVWIERRRVKRVQRVPHALHQSELMQLTREAFGDGV